MKKITYKTSGVCSRSIEIELDDNNIIQSVKFVGGCDGNLKGIASLAKGRSASEVIPLISGIKCGFKNTSCPDQLSRALSEAIK